ncbi:hypothetical protein CALK_1987 [Chitinivibrio alkaliphilus ACht1]|uniref:Uncharacterized protein n=1 Tax=Chitinivibrio alkaliphilus ACht1 TaxID=1313304 RepID=U7D7N3_9BACT|nr:hypothetical protein CALK_1987 [Chitinivibrio alkaliphilus ACht1]
MLKEFTLVIEIEIECANRYACSGGNILNCGLGISLFAEKILRCVNDMFFFLSFLCCVFFDVLYGIGDSSIEYCSILEYIFILPNNANFFGAFL